VFALITRSTIPTIAPFAALSACAFTQLDVSRRSA
jgi:hypothetical protein